VRDFTKWDDSPVTLTAFAESAARAYKISMTPPMMPVLLVADGELQENPVRDGYDPHVAKLTLASPPQGDEEAVAELARLLVAAENPVFIAGRAVRTPEGMARLVELAEALQAPVVDQSGRLNFPTRHPLYQLFQNDRSRQLIANADVIVGLDPVDFWGAVNIMRDQVDRTSHSITKPGTKLITITSGDLFAKSNYQNFQRYPDLDMALAADPEATLPSLIEAVKRLSNGDRKHVFEARGAKLATGAQEGLQRARDAAAFGWDASPVSTARLCAELWAQIKNEDWSLVSPVTFVNYWPLRLWDGTKPYHFLGDSGGYGIGYGAPAAVGAALANRKHGRLSVNIQCDGDFMYAPGVWWTAAHHHIPLLSVMHNNRAYHQERMQIQIMADRHSRGVTRADIGTAIADPDINYSKIAQGLGVYAEGPIMDPKDLGPAIQRALAVVKGGEPALIDVHTQPR
jgi:acetolactate synthase-1/2/3 large subunit